MREMNEKRQSGLWEAPDGTHSPSIKRRRCRFRGEGRRLLYVLLPVWLTLGLLLLAASWKWHMDSGRLQSAILRIMAKTPETGTALTEPRRRDASASPAATAEVLECFQVAQPVLTPGGAVTSDGHTAQSSGSSTAPADGCTVTLMDYVFGNSYGSPFVGNYVPPDCQFNRVVMNFTVVSEGRQFDRLALMFLNDTEVWRTSTAEPVVPPGIRWVYLKDMTHYLSLWRSPQTLIFDLGNLINDKYTGSFNTTLTATFFMSDVAVGAPPSDLIIPISAHKSASGSASHFSLPADNATSTVSFPRNAHRAVFSVSANGQAEEEFWWSNVLQTDTLAFNATAGQLTGFSPFREVQVRIDGQLAGVQWPFPVVFTGGVVPGLHRPVVGADVFDLREHEMDITPWLPVLCDGNPHTFSIQVAGLVDDGQSTAVLTETVGSSWYVSGKVFVWLDDDAASITTGSAPVVSGDAPSISITQNMVQNATGANETLHYTVSVARSFIVQGSVASQGSPASAGGSRTVWTQTLSYTNEGIVDGFGFDQINNFSIRGTDAAVVGGQSIYNTDYHFPIACNTTTSITDQGNLTLWADFDQGLELQVSGAAVFPSGLEAFVRGGSSSSGGGFSGGTVLRTRVNGTALFYQTGDGKNSSGQGSTSQTLRFGGLSVEGMLGSTPDVPLYTRTVTAINGTLVQDDEYISAGGGGGSSRSSGGDQTPSLPSSMRDVYAQAPLHGGTGPRAFMGRGGADPSVAVDVE